MGVARSGFAHGTPPKLLPKGRCGNLWAGVTALVQEPGCTKSSAGINVDYSPALTAAFAQRCQEPWVHQRCGARIHQLLRRSWWRQALSRAGVHQVSAGIHQATARPTAVVSGVKSQGAPRVRRDPPTTASLMVAASAVKSQDAPSQRDRIHQLLHCSRRRQALSGARDAPSRARGIHQLLQSLMVAASAVKSRGCTKSAR